MDYYSRAERRRVGGALNFNLRAWIFHLRPAAKREKSGNKNKCRQRRFCGTLYQELWANQQTFKLQTCFPERAEEKLPGWIGDGEKLRSTVYVYPFHAPNTKIDH